MTNEWWLLVNIIACCDATVSSCIYEMNNFLDTDLYMSIYVLPSNNYYRFQKNVPQCLVRQYTADSRTLTCFFALWNHKHALILFCLEQGAHEASQLLMEINLLYYPCYYL